MKDIYNRQINYLRISLTDRCNYRCIYCMPETGVRSLKHTDILTIEEIAHVVGVLSQLGIENVRLTGGEPLVRKGCVSLVEELNAMPNIKNIALTTNGVLLPKMAHELKRAGLSRVNISLDSLDEQQFHSITRLGHVQEALNGIDAAIEAGFEPVKVNCVAVRSLNQDYLAFARLSVDKPLHVRFIEYMPVGESTGSTGCGWGPGDVISCKQLRENINAAAASKGLPALEAANKNPFGCGPAQYFAFPGAAGTVGFISPMSKHFCGKCNRMRLTADGKLRPCLFSDTEFDVRGILRSSLPRTEVDAKLKETFARALSAKPEEHGNITRTERKMSQIGG